MGNIDKFIFKGDKLVNETLKMDVKILERSPIEGGMSGKLVRFVKEEEEESGGIDTTGGMFGGIEA